MENKKYLKFKIHVERFIQALYDGDILGWQDNMDLWFSDKGNLIIIDEIQFEKNLKSNCEFFEDWGLIDNGK